MRTRQCLMLSADIAHVLYRRNQGSLPATRTTDIPECGQSQGAMKLKQPCLMRQLQGAQIVPFEFPSEVAEATWRAILTHGSSHRQGRVTGEKACCEKFLFQHSRFRLCGVGTIAWGGRSPLFVGSAPEVRWDKRISVSGRKTQVRAGIFPSSQCTGIIVAGDAH
jgi:hypothetical protein